MNILLVNPPNSGKSIPEEEYGIENIKMIFRGEPLALEVIAGNLDGHEVRITDLKAEPDIMWDSLEEFQPDLVGITGVTCEANAVLDIAKGIKDRSDARVVVGGHHASCDPQFFNRDYIDYVAVGLAKLSFRQLVDELEAGHTENGIPGIGRTGGSAGLSFTIRNYSEADLVDEAAPRYDLIEKNRDKYVMSGVGGKMGFVVSAFGCTHRCLFCSIPNMTGNRYISHSVDAVVRDMMILKDLPMIRLVDANTFGDIELAEQLGRRIVESGLDKKIVADVRSDTVVDNPDLFKLWKEAGLAVAVIGFEEITDDRLKGLNKRNKVATNVKAMEILKGLGIKIIGDFIVSPDYTNDDFQQLEDFVKALPIDLPLPAVLTPIPGTPLHEKFKNDITVHDLDYYTFTNAVMPTKMPEKEFYQTYSALWDTFIGHVNH